MSKGGTDSGHGNSNPSGPGIKNKNPMTGEPYNLNHWDYLR